MDQADVRAIAFYLPQYHPIPENDLWWGKDFTEWVSVLGARELFPGHYQPHLPDKKLGFYDLRDPAVQVRQAQLAKRSGIHGFCYYYYWFSGKKLLERPVQAMLESGKPNFPFCLCWANGDWTRTWTGKDNIILMRQEYGFEDSRRFLRDVAPFLADSRYIRVNNKPLLIVFSPDLIPDIRRTADMWREEAAKLGLGELYLAKVENHGKELKPAEVGFDAAIEFAPDWRQRGEAVNDTIPVSMPPYVLDYRDILDNMSAKPAPDYTLFRGVFPGWDNTPRKGEKGLVFVNSSPKLFAEFLGRALEYTKQHLRGEERLLFINAWNEWGEGCHLEPDQKYGETLLSICRKLILKR